MLTPDRGVPQPALPRCKRIAPSVPLLAAALALAAQSAGAAPDSKPADTIRYYRNIRPLFQANCQGCHQPAKNKGGYVMTDFKRLLAGGDSEGVAIAPSQPDKSALLKMVTPVDGEIRMPKGKPPLGDSDVALI